jgi:hypothetical protein
VPEPEPEPEPPAPLFEAHEKGLVLFPFFGGRPEDGEDVVLSLARQQILRKIFTRVMPYTESTVGAVQFNRQYQRITGLGDTDEIFAAGRALRASHIVTGSFTSFSNQNLVLVSVVEVESQQQVAGFYSTFKDLDALDTFQIARQITEALERGSGDDLLGLTVLPFTVSNDVNRNDALVLAKILSFEIANAGKYAVIPRSGSLEMVQQEGEGPESTNLDSAPYVLVGNVHSVAGVNKFTVDIYDRPGINLVDWGEERYSDFAEGLSLMPKLALALTDKVALAELRASEAEEAEKQRLQAEREMAQQHAADLIAAEQRQAANAQATAQQQQLAAQTAEATRAEAQAQAEAEEEKARREAFWHADGTKLWSVGANIGTSFGTPLFIANLNITAAPIRYSFFEFGFDVGFGNNTIGFTYLDERGLGAKTPITVGHEDVSYYSVYPYLRFNGFIPLDKALALLPIEAIQNGFPFSDWISLYAGLGMGFFYSHFYHTTEEDIKLKASSSTPTLDITIGTFFGKNRHLARLSWALRTNFSGTNSRAYLGYSFRYY